MDRWPEGWTRGPGQGGVPQERTQALPRGDYGRPGPGPRDYPGYGGGSGGELPWEGTRGDRYRRKPRRWGGKIAVLLLVLIVLIPVAVYFYADSKLRREPVLSALTDRPEETPGTDWLIVGSDSRAGLSKAERREFKTGNAGGRRTDTMMLLHIPETDDPPTLISLPRDSYVPIPGHGRNKLNAAFAFGGPKLLAQTVENVTDIRIDHYAEIGLGGFVGITDAIGGVDVCVKEDIEDPKAGIDLKEGCQTLEGVEALGYVRTRATPLADLDRVKRQRQFFGALMKKAMSPGVLINPFRSIPLVTRGADLFIVDEEDHLYNLMGFGWALKDMDEAVTTTVPIAGTGSVPGAGSVVRWDREKAIGMFDALREDKPVPKSLIPKD
ncbi:MAG: LytR family transcriptional regulator [Streptosporangiales bacterium]|nr:LytR family transcriptional regulator [Streptosporangiales bacterium]